jgi:hypothetical protein
VGRGHHRAPRPLGRHRGDAAARAAPGRAGGKRLGFVSNDQWQAYRMLPKLKALLEADFPGVEVLPVDA